VSTNRLEAFSDGVLAVAITLLVLDIRVPSVGGNHSLAHELSAQWPVYAAYVTSFITIGIIWINHHAMIGRLAQADSVIMSLNLLLLMSIAALPFATSLMAAYLKQSHGQHLAAGVYSGSFLVMSIFFLTLNRHILFRKAHLLGLELSAEVRRRLIARSAIGVLPYAIATATAAVSAYATLIICAAVAAYYAFPFSRDGGR
jgi:TMEM175 potassium channel family protein